MLAYLSSLMLCKPWLMPSLSTHTHTVTGWSLFSQRKINCTNWKLKQHNAAGKRHRPSVDLQQRERGEWSMDYFIHVCVHIQVRQQGEVSCVRMFCWRRENTWELRTSQHSQLTSDTHTDLCIYLSMAVFTKRICIWFHVDTIIWPRVTIHWNSPV